MKIVCKNKLLVYCLIICFALKCTAESDPIAETRYLTAFQYADFAGEGTFVDHADDTLVIDVKNYWFGSFPTNPVPITGAFLEWVDDDNTDATNYFKGKTIVFFAMTNEWKVAIHERTMDFHCNKIVYVYEYENGNDYAIMQSNPSRRSGLPGNCHGS
jgi:hypothetical protein